MANIVNLEQIRAKNACTACENNSFGGKNKGEIAKKLPRMIRENGMLGTLAFALDKDEADYEKSFDAIAFHLNHIGKVNSTTAKDLLEELLYCKSLQLRDVTVETMLYLDYFRRFAEKKAGVKNE